MALKIWVEWICVRCDQIHRMKFSVEHIQRQTPSIKGISKVNEEIYIMDTVSAGKKSAANKGTKIFVGENVELKDVFAAIADHMTLYYSIDAESLSMDVCRE